MPRTFSAAITFMVIALILFGMSIWYGRTIKSRKAAFEASNQDDDHSYISSRPSQPDLGNLLLTRRILRIAASSLVALSLIMTFFVSAVSVSTKNVGIVTSFGRPTGNLGNGLHFVAPWEKVTELDAAVQTDTYNQGPDPQHPNCVPIRIAYQAVACVDVSIVWQLNQEKSEQVFRDYRTFEGIRGNLVKRQLVSALNEILKGYDPLGIDAEGRFTAADNKKLSDDAEAKIKLDDKITDNVTVDDVTISLIHFDPNTQKRIDGLQGQVAQTRIAAQKIITANNEALANGKLTASVSQNPNVLVSKCFDLIDEMLSRNMVPPVAFSCWPGSGSSVVIPQAPANAK